MGEGKGIQKTGILVEFEKFYINREVSHNGGSFINGWVTLSNANYIMTETIEFSPTIIAAIGKY